MPAAGIGRSAHLHAPITGAAAKAATRRETGAVAVDMESSAVAEVAAASHVPFMAIRVIVDTALDAIPASVTAAGESGQIRIRPAALTEAGIASSAVSTMTRIAMNGTWLAAATSATAELSMSTATGRFRGVSPPWRPRP